MRSISGVVIGLVVDVNDPESEGRVKLSFPWMSEGEPQSNWARIAAPMSGPERGFFFLPEIDDEVLVAFEQGDLRLPYVIGFLWNGEQKPPHSEPTRRTIHTVSGHRLEFEDKAGSEKISLLFKGAKPSITLQEEVIEIVLNDTSSIKLESGTLTIQFDGTTSIVLSAGGVKVSGAKIELN
ncbi:MAG: phage tail protein [Oscillochloris sp.]|nr:phage tail protein [Oscillochloris sp.]